MITIVGGTGLLGRVVAARLLEDSHRVRVVARHEPATPVPGAEFIAADVRAPETLPAALRGSEVVVSAMHGMDPNAGQSPASVDRDGNRALIAAARAIGADLVLMSIVGAAPDHPIELFRRKAEAEAMLRDARDGAADWTIVRSSAFAEMWLGMFRAMAGKSGVPKVMGPGRNPINFVSAHDVAAAVARAAGDRSLRGKVIEVTGENLSMTDVAALVTPAGKVPGHLPTAVIRVMGIALQPVRPGMARILRQTLAMEQTPLKSDPGPVHAEYAWLPHTPIAEVAAHLAAPTVR